MVRGKILKYTADGDGIVFADGKQIDFSLTQHWRSPVAPKVGDVVDIELNQDTQIINLTVVDETTIAKEQAKKIADQLSALGKEHGGAFISKIGLPNLFALAVLFIGWMFLNTINVQVSQNYKIGASFYEILKLINNNGDLSGLGNIQNSNAGIYGFFAWIIIFLPVASHFHPSKYLKLSYCAPFIYSLLIAIIIYFSIKSGISQATDLTSSFIGKSVETEKMIKEMMSMTLRAMSFGLGYYISIVASIYLFYVGVKKFLVSNPSI